MKTEREKRLEEALSKIAFQIDSYDGMKREAEKTLEQHSEPGWIPEGWKLVPVEPTPTMQQSYFDAIDQNMDRVETDPGYGRYENHRSAYRAMLAATPAPDADERE